MFQGLLEVEKVFICKGLKWSQRKIRKNEGTMKEVGDMIQHFTMSYVLKIVTVHFKINE